jgi:Peptidase A4 family
LSSNWSGLIGSGAGTTFTSVQADWVVPSIRVSSSDEASGTWVGIDGDGVSSLIQAGTAQNSGPDFGGTQYYAWVELLPGGPVVIGNTSGAAPVQPGDVMAASIFEGSPGTWTIDLSDTTQGWSFAQQFSYDTPGLTAEWIEEAPTIDGAVATLSDYGSATFTDLGAGGTAVTAATLNPVYMTGPSGAIISYPADFSASANSFSLFYGSPSSQNTPVSSSPPPPPVTLPSTTSHGYWLVGSDGGIFSFGSAPFYGSTGAVHLQRPVVGIVATGDRGGYWLGASDGGIFAFGDAGFYGSLPGLGLHPAGSGLPNSLNAPIVGIVPSADGRGYLMVASDGGVFAFGGAGFLGSCPGIGGCAGAAVAVMPDASGEGYWVVTQTGHVYTFGDAPYYGAPGPQGVPVSSAVRTPDGRGYCILFANGAIASYGDALSHASPLGQMDASDPATAIFTTSDGAGYWVAAADGAVDSYGDAPDDGSMLGIPLNGSIVAATGW